MFYYNTSDARQQEIDYVWSFGVPNEMMLRECTYT